MKYSATFFYYFSDLKHANIGSVDFKPTVQALVGDAQNNDQVHLFLKIKQNCIIMAAFHASGCAAMLAAAEYVCAQIENQPIEHAVSLTPDAVLNALQLPTTLRHVAVLLHDAITQCLSQYKEIQ